MNSNSMILTVIKLVVLTESFVNEIRIIGVKEERERDISIYKYN